MKFRFKIMILMNCMLAVLFAIGGTALISISFQSALNREEQTALQSTKVLLETMQMLDGIEGVTNEKGIVDVLKRITQHESFPVISLSSKDEVLFVQGEAAVNFLSLNKEVVSDSVSVAYFTDNKGNQYLQITTGIQWRNQLLYLNLGRDLSGIYQLRTEQESAYQKIYIVMLLLCVTTSYILTKVLTRPLHKLSMATNAIASGNLAYRVQIHTSDEIGQLSKEFDRMAWKVEQSMIELKEAVRRQEEFMGNFTHELKTPMTSIIGYADLIRSNSLEQVEQQEAANYIFYEGKRLEHLSLLLLDLFVLNKKEFPLRKVSPKEMVANLVVHLSDEYEKLGIQLHNKGEQGYCMMEPDLIHTLLWNLVDNSKKSMGNGGRIDIITRMIEDGCSYEVYDTGEGIPEDELVYVTEAFYRVDKSRSRTAGNAGLGLSLCAKIAELHHGQIQIESRIGVGTKVTVVIRGGRG